MKPASAGFLLRRLPRYIALDYPTMRFFLVCYHLLFIPECTGRFEAIVGGGGLVDTAPIG